MRAGPRNHLSDVAGISVGNAEDRAALTGVTVVRCAGACVAAVDVRGGAPGTRETDALALDGFVGRADAIVLSGGSVFGLAAADGVAAALSAEGVGLRLSADGPAIPIVPAAVLHDLGNGGDKAWGDVPPYRALGVAALAAAGADAALGAAGAGLGARAGLVAGGLGAASLDLGDGMVAALVAQNSVGAGVMPDGTPWAWPFELDGEFGGRRPGAGVGAGDPLGEGSRLGPLGLAAGAATVIAVVATSLALTQAEARRMAMMAHDGIARAVRPAHTPFDGDTVFALATGKDALDPARSRAWHVARAGSAAADCLARAMARAVWLASGAQEVAGR